MALLHLSGYDGDWKKDDLNRRLKSLGVGNTTELVVKEKKLKIVCTLCQKSVVAGERRKGLGDFKRHLNSLSHKTQSERYQDKKKASEAHVARQDKCKKDEEVFKTVEVKYPGVFKLLNSSSAMDESKIFCTFCSKTLPLYPKTSSLAVIVINHCKGASHLANTEKNVKQSVLSFGSAHGCGGQSK